MIEPHEQRADWEDVEALVRAAGGYVRPSEELRPRVLEAARAESRERQAQLRVWQLAIAIAIVCAVSTGLASQWNAAAPFTQGLLQVQADARPTEGGAPGWRMVDSFTDLRRRQAALLNLSK